MNAEQLNATWEQATRSALGMFQDVKQFHTQLGLPIGVKPQELTGANFQRRWDHLKEELQELSEAYFANDLAGQADALVDAVYVLLGTAVEMGLPWEALWNDVQRANLLRVREDDGTGHKLGVKKPPNWIGPRTEEILRAYRESHDAQHQALDNL